MHCYLLAEFSEQPCSINWGAVQSLDQLQPASIFRVVPSRLKPSYCNSQTPVVTITAGEVLRRIQGPDQLHTKKALGDFLGLSKGDPRKKTEGKCFPSIHIHFRLRYFLQATQHLAAMALSQPPPQHSISPWQQKVTSISSMVLSTSTSILDQWWVETQP